MAGEVINGVIGVDDVLQGKRVKDATQGLTMRYQDRNPFLAVQLRLSKARTITNPTFSWFFKDEHPYWDEVDPGLGTPVDPNTSQTFPVSNTGMYAPGDVLYFPTAAAADGTPYGVVSNVTDTEISIATFVYDSNGDPVPLCTKDAGDRIFNYADSQPGWGTPPNSKIVKAVEFENHPQFLRAPYEIDVWMLGQKTYTASSEEKERSQELHDAIRRRMEQVAIWGEKGYRYLGGTTEAGKQYFAAGLKQQIAVGAPENIITLPADWTESDLDDALINGPGKAGVGSQKRFWFMGTAQFLRLSEIMKGKERITQQDVSIAGIRFKKYSDPSGKVYYIHVHNSFEDALTNDSLIVDASQVRIRNYREQGVLTLHKGIQANNQAGLQNEWRSIFSIQLMNPYSCAYITQS